MSKIKRNLRFVRKLVVMKLQRTMSFRASFFAGAMVDSSLFVMWLLMFVAIYSQTDSIGGWDKGQTIVFLGTFSMLNAINMVLYFFGVLSIPQKIASGELDLYITKPVSPLLRLSFENVNLGSSPLILVSAAIIIYGLSLGGIEVTAGRVALYILYLGLMALLYYDLELMLRTVAFFSISDRGLNSFEAASFDLCMRVPGTLFQGVFKFLFYFLAPYGIMATVPAQLLFGDASWKLLLYCAGICVLFTALALWFWRFGLRRYKSASS